MCKPQRCWATAYWCLHCQRCPCCCTLHCVRDTDFRMTRPVLQTLIALPRCRAFSAACSANCGCRQPSLAAGTGSSLPSRWRAAASTSSCCGAASARSCAHPAGGLASRVLELGKCHCCREAAAGGPPCTAVALTHWPDHALLKLGVATPALENCAVACGGVGAVTHR